MSERSKVIKANRERVQPDDEIPDVGRKNADMFAGLTLPANSMHLIALRKDARRAVRGSDASRLLKRKSEMTRSPISALTVEQLNAIQHGTMSFE